MDDPCIVGPKMIWHDGMPRTAVRVLFMALFDIQSMHPTWRAVRMCATENCVNPLHHDLEVRNNRSGVPIQPLPSAAIERLLVEMAAEVTDESEISDAVDMILMVDGRTWDIPRLHARFNGEYEAHILEAALAQIKEQGL